MTMRELATVLGVGVAVMVATGLLWPHAIIWVAGLCALAVVGVFAFALDRRQRSGVVAVHADPYAVAASIGVTVGVTVTYYVIGLLASTTVG